MLSISFLLFVIGVSQGRIDARNGRLIDQTMPRLPRFKH